MMPCWVCMSKEGCFARSILASCSSAFAVNSDRVNFPRSTSEALNATETVWLRFRHLLESEVGEPDLSEVGVAERETRERQPVRPGEPLHDAGSNNSRCWEASIPLHPPSFLSNSNSDGTRAAVNPALPISCSPNLSYITPASLRVSPSFSSTGFSTHTLGISGFDGSGYRFFPSEEGFWIGGWRLIHGVSCAWILPIEKYFMREIVSWEW